jgi:hypothetical protein
MEAREEKKSRAAHCLLDFLRNGTWLVCTSRASQRLNKACELLNFSSKQKTEGGTKKEGPEETKIPQRKCANNETHPWSNSRRSSATNVVHSSESITAS